MKQETDPSPPKRHRKKILDIERAVKQLRAEQPLLSASSEQGRRGKQVIFRLLYCLERRGPRYHLGGFLDQPESHRSPNPSQTMEELGREILDKRKGPPPPPKIDRVVLATLIKLERPGQPWLIEDWWYKAAIVQELKKHLPSKEGQGLKTSQSESKQWRNKRERDRLHGAKRNYQKSAELLAKRAQEQEQRYVKYGRTAKQAKMEAKRVVIGEFKTTSRARNKEAILAIFNGIYPTD